MSYKSYILTFCQFKFEVKHNLTWIEAVHNSAIHTVKDVINKCKEVDQIQVTRDLIPIGFVAHLQLTLNICQQATLH